LRTAHAGCAIKMQPNTLHLMLYKHEIRSRCAPCDTLSLSTFTITLESRSRSLLGRCWRQLREICAHVNMAHSRVEHVFVLGRFFTSQPSAAVREACSNVHPDKEVPSNDITPTGNNVSGHSKCLFVASDHRATEQMKLWLYRLQSAHQPQQRHTAN
jgi:hypothetical protein